MVSLLYASFAFIEFSFAHVFKHKIGVNAIYVMLESNKNEASEFLSVYFKPELFIVAILFISSILFSVWFARRYFNKISTYQVPKMLRVAVLTICVAVIYIKGTLLPVYALKTTLSYQEEQQKINAIPLSLVGNYKNVTSNSKEDEEIVVLIIGESTTRNHMGLYNYYRDTNPLLTKRKEELLIFNDVISPHTHTLESLDKALILEDNKDLGEKFNHTLVQLFNAADFSTYWLSNQEPMGVFGNSTRIISKTSTYEHFTDGLMLDEIVLKPLQDALNSDEKKKFIVIHLMATHFDYESRYPAEFEKFTSKPQTEFAHELAYEKINKYDNAVLYNDYIIDQIISEVAAKKKYASILYLSDHGEDVYETIDEACHTEAKGTKPMFDIPFFIWQSQQAKNARSDIFFDADRKYSSEDLVHTMADLAKIKFQKFDVSKSIINASFKEKERIILKDKNYEETFNSQ